jgi:hypothetical protein
MPLCVAVNHCPGHFSITVNYAVNYGTGITVPDY